MLTFAIVSPSLNQSHFLPTALESLRHQGAPFQIAVMDGGSKDNFNEVIQEYSDIITFLRSERDEGQAAAIREGKEKIPGEIVAWLNADDYYFPGALDKVASFFENDAELDVVYGDAIHVTSDGLFLSYFPPIQSYNTKVLTRRCFICQPACFVRRTAYERVGRIDATLQYTMDWDLWCRLSLYGAKFQYIHEPLAAVRYYQGTKTLSQDWLRYKEIWRIERKYGHRLLPLSWPGFYRYDLFFRKNKTAYVRTALGFLELLRVFKRRLFRNQGWRKELDRPIYGFDRLEPIVNGHCMIRLPWFDNREWSTLYLRVEPLDKEYHILVNGRSCKYELSEGACLAVEVPQIGGPYRMISIERSEKDRWRFLGFSLDFN